VKKKEGPVYIYYVSTIFPFSNNIPKSPWLLENANYNKNENSPGKGPFGSKSLSGRMMLKYILRKQYD
jgi:hypothetical protein